MVGGEGDGDEWWGERRGVRKRRGVRREDGCRRGVVHGGRKVGLEEWWLEMW